MKRVLFVLVPFMVRLLLLPTITAQAAPASGTWSTTGSMSTPRSGAIAALLRNGKVPVAVGYENGNFLGTAYPYTPAN